MVRAFLLTVLITYLPFHAQAASDRVHRAQTILHQLGYDVGKIDGVYGKRTRAAIFEINPNHDQRTISDEDVKFIENAYIEKFDEYPVFGSKYSSNPMKIAPIENSVYPGWSEELKTELHQIDVSNADFSFMPFSFYSNYAKKYPSPKGSTYAEDQASQYDCDYVLANMHERPSNIMAGTINKAGIEDATATQWCGYVLREDFPYVGSAAIQEVLDRWASTPVSTFAPDMNNSDNIYGHNAIYATLATTYALFYDQFNNRDGINDWLINWGLTYEQTHRTGESIGICPFHDPMLMNVHRKKGGKFKSSSSCGSKRWRSAIAKISLGLRLNNEDIFLSGVRHLESVLAMIDENGIFVHYASRGFQGPGYLVDVPLYLNDLAMIFEQVGFDFYELKTTSGLTVAEIIDQSTMALAELTPLKKYIEGTGHYGTRAIWENIKDPEVLNYLKNQSHIEHHNLLMRTLHYNAVRNHEKTPNPQTIIKLVSYYLYDGQKPELFHGFTSAVPIVPAMEYYYDKKYADKKYLVNDDFYTYVKSVQKQRTEQNRDKEEFFLQVQKLRAALGLDPEPFVITERRSNRGGFDKLNLPVEFPYWRYFTVNNVRFPARTSDTQSFAFELFRMSKAGMQNERYGSLILRTNGDNLTVVRASGDVLAQKGDVIGKKSGDFLTLELQTKLCRDCGFSTVNAHVAAKYKTGISEEAADDVDQTRIVLLPY